jgi:hypothetical protein
MRKLLVLGASLALFSVMAFADSWSGTLVDATCAMQNQSQPSQQSQAAQPDTQAAQSGQQATDQAGKWGSNAACEPSSTTTAFALRTMSGQTYQLDDAGNAKVITAMKDRADRMKDEGTSSTSSGSSSTGSSTGASTAMAVHATVKGALNNNIIKVDSVQMQ